MPIERSVIAEILAKTDLVALIGAHVPLTRRGQSFVGLCPFHSERSPSFHVRPERGFFKCFGCGVGGDAIRFVERFEQLSFIEATQALAKRVGVVIEEETPQAQTVRAQREALYAANRIAAEFFQREFQHSPSAEIAREYCRQRAISPTSIERFQLGYAPDSWEALPSLLRAAGIDQEIALQVGLLKEGQRGAYAFYRDRLIIPILTLTGEVVAFGARTLRGEEPKYLNTSGTPIYSKSHHLFGLSLARRAVGQRGAFIVVEGYLDCIALHDAGFEQSVAVLGTALTIEQATLLRRFTQNIYMVFDADPAGQEATIRSLSILERAGCRARVVLLPAGEDPDSFIRKHGAQAFEQALQEARHAAEVLIDHRLQSLKDGFHAPNEIAREAEQIVRQQPRAEWDRWRLYTAERLGLSIDDVRRAAPRMSRYTSAVSPVQSSHSPTRIPPSRERELLTILLEEPALLHEYRALIRSERIREPLLARLYAALCAAPKLESAIDAMLATSGDEMATEALLALTSDEKSSAVRFAGSDERRQALDMIIEAYSREDDEERLRVISAEIDAYLLQAVSVPKELITEQQMLEQRLYRHDAVAKRKR